MNAAYKYYTKSSRRFCTNKYFQKRECEYKKILKIDCLQKEIHKRIALFNKYVKSEETKQIEEKIRMQLKEDETKKREDEIRMQLEDDEFKCPICFGVLIRPTILNCKHIFCEWCIHTWLIYYGTCAMCRSTVTSEKLCLELQSHINNMLIQTAQEYQESYNNIDNSRAQDNEKNLMLRAERVRMERITFELNTNFHNNIR